MATLKDYRDERLRKLEELKKLGFNPYPAKGTVRIGSPITTAAAKNNFEEHQDKDFTLQGRIVGIRKFGKIAFLVLKDFSDEIQLFLGSETVVTTPEKNLIGVTDLSLLDSGDFIEAGGKLIKTKTGEISIEVRELCLLTKSLRPLPTEQEGFTNKEERLRRRYIDTNANHDVYERYLRRSAFWKANRDFLLEHGFTEINIPVLENTAGGADANPFVTHMDALDQDFYLRISHELPLKRLLVGGYTQVFDIGPRFRNENYSDEHLPEHVAMEWYWAYADWQDGMKLTQKLIRCIADKTWNKRQFTLSNGQEVDLGSDEEDFPKISFVDVIKENYNIDVFNTTIEEVAQKLKENNLEVEKTDSIGRGIDKLWKKVRVNLAGPAFLIDIPTFLQPLAKTQPGKPELTEQFNLILGGTEACKAYSELNDPIDQLNRFKQQQALRDSGDAEAMMMDIDYVEALEYGMPPACGYGHSERIFWMLEGVTAREGVPFPQLRREISETTKSIYSDINL
jgi:lysyl-tRNA synthetase class 2